MENIEALFIEWWEKTGNEHIGNTFTKLRAAFYDGYRQGRADQNEADVAVIGGFFGFDIYRTVKQNQNMMALCRKLQAAIRAAGPEVGNER